MFRLWARVFKENHMLKDTVVECPGDDTRTHKVMWSLNEACVRFDLAGPIWLDTNIRDFKKRSKTRFRADSFIEDIDFDYLEIQVIEEDYGGFGA